MHLASFRSDCSRGRLLLRSRHCSACRCPGKQDSREPPWFCLMCGGMGATTPKAPPDHAPTGGFGTVCSPARYPAPSYMRLTGAAVHPRSEAESSCKTISISLPPGPTPHDIMQKKKKRKTWPFILTGRSHGYGGCATRLPRGWWHEARARGGCRRRRSCCGRRHRARAARGLAGAHGWGAGHTTV